MTQLEVALWSKFPSAYVTEKIQPKLAARGIVVTKLLTERLKDTDLTSVDVVLCMHENASHHEFDHLREIAKASKKQVIAFSRKESFWERDLKPLAQMKDEKMAGPKAIPDAKLDAFCRKFIELKQKGNTYDQMIPLLGQFWVHGKLDNAHQLRQHVRQLVQKGRAPEFFSKFMEQQEKERREQEILHEQTLELEASPVPPSNLNGKSLPPVSNDLDLELQLYKEENEKIVGLNKRLKQDNDYLHEQVAKLEGQNRPHGESVNLKDPRFMKILANIFEAVELEVMEKSDAFEKIFELYKKTYQK